TVHSSYLLAHVDALSFPLLICLSADAATSLLYALSLHDALPISAPSLFVLRNHGCQLKTRVSPAAIRSRCSATTCCSRWICSSSAACRRTCSPFSCISSRQCPRLSSISPWCSS